VTLYTGGSDGFVSSTAAPIASGWSEPSSRGRDRAEARALDQERSSHVSSGPPAIPEGRISRFRFWPWLSPVRSSRDRWSLSARSHAPQPTSVYPAAVLKFMAPPIFVVGHVRTPSAQSSFAWHERYSRQGDVLHHLEGRYPFFLAPTSSCAKPVPSSGIRVSTLISRGPCRLLRASAGIWFFPTLSLPVFPRMLEPLIPPGCRVHLPVSSPTSSAFPKSRLWVGLPESPAKRLRAAGVSRSSLFLTFRPPGLLATQVSPTATPKGAGQLWLLHPSKSRTVTVARIG